MACVYLSRKFIVDASNPQPCNMHARTVGDCPERINKPVCGLIDESKDGQGVLLAVWAHRGVYASPRYGSAGCGLRPLDGLAIERAIFRAEQGSVRAI